MRLEVAATALAVCAVPLWAGAQAHRRTPVEPSYTFALLDKKLTVLGQQQMRLVDGNTKRSIVAARSMKRTAASIERTAFRLQGLC